MEAHRTCEALQKKLLVQSGFFQVRMFVTPALILGTRGPSECQTPLIRLIKDVLANLSK
jgi:hypothetical protein